MYAHAEARYESAFGWKKQVARELEIHDSYLSHLLNRGKGVGPKLHALALERLTTIPENDLLSRPPPWLLP